MRAVIWSIKDIVSIAKLRQDNEFDANIAVSGDRGNGKSTLIFKILTRCGKFDAWKHQVYNRDDILNLLKTEYKGYCFDDEAINSGYKRDFQNKAQQELIKFLTAYRDRFNIYASAIPSFFSLDKDLRDLYFLHLHVLERGIAVVHRPLQGRLYSQDQWDSKYNAKIEDSWSKKMQRDATFKPPYHKLSTFVGYLYWKDLTPKQKELYKKVKFTKRQDSFLTEDEKNRAVQKGFVERIYELLLEGKVTKEGLIQMCLVEGKKYSSLVSGLNRLLKDDGHTKTMKEFLNKADTNNIHSKGRVEINKLLSGI